MGSGTHKLPALVGSSALPLRIGKATQRGTRPGKVNNEDSIVHFVSSFGDVFVLADGMGGHGNGDLASAIVVSSFRETLMASAGMGIEDSMKYALQIAHSRIIETVDQRGLVRGVGSTVVVAIIQDDAAYVGHVGDSRCYLCHEDELHQITHDHSLVQAEIDAGRLTEQEAAVDSRASTLTRAVGATENLELELSEPVYLQEGDAILLCSDGLHGFVDRTAIAYVVRKNLHDAQRVADALVSMAATVGNSDDDISVIFAQFGAPKIYRPSPVFTEGRSAELLARKQAAAPAPAMQPVAVPLPAESEVRSQESEVGSQETGFGRQETEVRSQKSGVLSRIRRALGFLSILALSLVLLSGGFYLVGKYRPAWMSSILPEPAKKVVADQEMEDSEPVEVDKPEALPQEVKAVTENPAPRNRGLRMKVETANAKPPGSSVTFEVKDQHILDRLKKRARQWPPTLQSAIRKVQLKPVTKWQYGDFQVVLLLPPQAPPAGPPPVAGKTDTRTENEKTESKTGK